MRDKSISIRDEIVKNSIGLFLRKGFKGTTIQEITDSVGVSKGAFYWYFNAKDELLNTIIEHYEHIFIDEIIKTVLEAEGSPLQKLRYAHKFATEFAYANRNLCVGFLTIAAEMVGSGTEAEAKIRNIYARYRSFYKTLLREGKAQGVIRADIDTDLISHVINAIHNGMLLEWYLYYEDGQVDARKFAIAYREIILEGILRKET